MKYFSSCISSNGTFIAGVCVPNYVPRALQGFTKLEGGVVGGIEILEDMVDVILVGF
jgi:hypothetical protein